MFAMAFASTRATSGLSQDKAYLCCDGRLLKFFQPSVCSLVADVPSFISMPRMPYC